MLEEVLNLGAEVQIDLLYLNKAGTLVCGFEQSGDGTFLKQELEITEKRSLLKMAVHDTFIPGKLLGPSKFENILSNKSLNSKSDLPLTENRQRLLEDPRGLHQIVHPIMTKNLQNVKMVVRLTTTERDLLLSASQLQFVKFAIDEVSSAILTGLAQFKTLSK